MSATKDGFVKMATTKSVIRTFMDCGTPVSAMLFAILGDVFLRLGYDAKNGRFRSFSESYTDTEAMFQAYRSSMEAHDVTAYDDSNSQFMARVLRPIGQPFYKEPRLTTDLRILSEMYGILCFRVLEVPEFGSAHNAERLQYAYLTDRLRGFLDEAYGRVGALL